MKKNILFAALMAASIYSAKAQIPVSNDALGRPMEVKAPDNTIGDMYLFSDWTKGHVLQNDDKYFNNMSLKYDVFNDRVIFSSPGGGPMAFQNPVKEFQLLHSKSLNGILSVFRNGFPAILNFTPNSYYQVLAEGKATLLKKIFKTTVQSIPYGESQVKNTFILNENYFLYHNGSMVKIQKNKASAINEIGNKSNELNAFIKEKKLGMKSDQDLAALIDYYNTLN